MTESNYSWQVQMGGVSITYTIEEKNKMPQRIFITRGKTGSVLTEALKKAGLQASKSLKNGVPLREVVNAWLDLTSPMVIVEGYSPINEAVSPLDFGARLLSLEYLADTSFAQTAVDLKKLRCYQ